MLCQGGCQLRAGWTRAGKNCTYAVPRLISVQSAATRRLIGWQYQIPQLVYGTWTQGQEAAPTKFLWVDWPLYWYLQNCWHTVHWLGGHSTTSRGHRMTDLHPSTEFSCVVNVRVWGSRRMAPLVLNLCTRWWAISFTPRLLPPQQKKTRSN